MGKFERYKWKMITSYSDGTTVEQPTYRKILLDSGLKTAGALLCGSAMYLMGEFLDYNTGTTGSSQILGPIGALIGFFSSKSEASNPNKLDYILAYPFFKTMK